MTTETDSLKGRHSSILDEIFAPFGTILSTLFTALLCASCFLAGTIVERHLCSNEVQQTALIKGLKSDVRFWKLICQEATPSSLQEKIDQLEAEQKNLTEENSALKKQNEKLSQITELLSEGISALDTKVKYLKSEQQQ